MDLGRVVINVPGVHTLEVLEAVKKLPDEVIQRNPRNIIVTWNNALTGPILDVPYRDSADYTKIKFTPPSDSTNINSFTDTVHFDYQETHYTLSRYFSDAHSAETGC